MTRAVPGENDGGPPGVKGLASADPKMVASGFKGAGPKNVAPILKSLAGLGQSREVERGCTLLDGIADYPPDFSIISVALDAEMGRVRRRTKSALRRM